MISKILISRSLFLGALFKAPLLNFSSYRSNIVESLEINDCRSIDELAKHISRWEDIEMPPRDFKLYCDQLSYVRISTNSSYPMLKVVNILKQQKVENMSINIVSCLCEALSIAQRCNIYDNNLVEQLNKKIEMIIENKDSVEEVWMDNLIKIYAYVCSYRKTKLIKGIVNIMMEQSPNMQFKHVRSLIEVFERRRFPSFQEQMLFGELIKFIKTNFDKMNMNIKIDFFKKLSSLNHMVWNTENLPELIEKSIQENFHQVEFVNIIHLLKYKSSKNSFIPFIFNKTLEFINDDGSCSLDADKIITIFDFTAQTGPAIKFLQGKKMQEKLIKFIEANCLENSQKWINLLRKNFLKENHINAIQTVYQKKEFNQSNLAYLYELARKNIWLENYDEYLLKINRFEDNEFRVNQSFVQNCLLLNRLRYKFPEDKRIEEIWAKYLSLIKQIGKEDSKDIVFLSNINYIETLTDFHRHFSPHYMKNLLENNLFWEVVPEESGESNKKSSESNRILKNIKSPLKKYLLAVGDIHQLGKLIKVFASPELAFRLVNEFLNSMAFSIQIPSTSQISLIYRLLAKFEVTGKNSAIFLRILSNWGFHDFASPDAVENILHNSIRLMEISNSQTETRSENNDIIWSFVSYIIQSPNKSLKASQLYIRFLRAMMNVQGKIKNQRIFLPLVNELIKNGLLTQEFILKNEGTQYNNETILSYLDFMKGNLTLDVVPSAKNILGIVRFGNCDYLTEHKEKIIEIIESSNIYKLQEIILNFYIQISQGQVVNHIFSTLIQKYGKLIENFWNPKRIPGVFYRCQVIGYKPDYNFLNNVAQNYSHTMMHNSVSSMADFAKRLVLHYGKLNTASFVSQATWAGLKRVKENEGNQSDILKLGYYLSLLDREAINLYEKGLNNSYLATERPINLIRVVSIIRHHGNASQRMGKIMKVVVNLLLDRKISLQESDIKYLCHVFPELVDAIKKIQVQKHKEYSKVEIMDNLLIKTGDKIGVNIKVIEKCGLRLLEIGEKRKVFISGEVYSPVHAATIKKYIKVVFDLEESVAQNVFVIFCGSKGLKSLSVLLEKDISELAPGKEAYLELLQNLKEKKTEEEEQQSEEEQEEEEGLKK